MTRFTIAVTVALSLAAVNACSDPAAPDSDPVWNGSISTWGSMQEVLGKGQTQGRVALADLRQSGTYAVGAVAALAGEITIVDGQVWVAAAHDGTAHCKTLESGDATEATLLVAAQVPSWSHHSITADVPATEVDGYLRKIAAAAGLDITKPFPFVIEGRIADVQAHVVNGMCPMRATPTSEQAPVRLHFARPIGTVVGIFAEGRGGVLTHHGASTHMHVVVPGDTTHMGHVESVALVAGSTLLLPRR